MPIFSKKEILWCILAPMLLSVAGMRFFHQFIDPSVEVHIAGYHVHHLYFGLLIQMPAAFLLAFGLQKPLSRLLALAALGTGSGLILDEVVFLIVNEAVKTDYLAPVSLWGALILTAATVGFLAVFSLRPLRRTRSTGKLKLPSEVL